MLSPQVWLEAATQIFFSLGVATGTLTALASYSKPHDNALRDTFIICIINSVTSISIGIVVFSISGFIAKLSSAKVELVLCVCVCIFLSVCTCVCAYAKEREKIEEIE